jgi:lysine 6-dehydrogenase
MSSFLILGGGRMAEGVAHDLLRSGHRVTVYDADSGRVFALQNKFQGWREKGTFYVERAECADPQSFDGKPVIDVIISTLPYDYSYVWSQAAIRWGVHFLDLGGNNDVVAKQMTLTENAQENDVAIVPDCGLAPGVVSILAQDLLVKAGAFNSEPGLFSIEMAVGGLPLIRDNPLEYQIVFSPHGLINEYIEPTVILVNGKLVTTDSMYGVETFSMPWGFDKLEKFYTSGGASTLPASLQGVCRNVSYKTIRYQGHAEKMRLLLQLFLQERRTLEKLLQDSIPLTGPDVILLDVVCREHEVMDEEYGSVRDVIVGRHRIIEYSDGDLTAMAKMTAFPAAIIAQALANGTITKRGVLKQEELFDDPSYMVGELKKRGIKFI